MPKTKEEMCELNKATRFKAGKEQQEIAKRAAKKSAEVRKERKLFKEEILKRMGAKDWDEVVDNLIQRAKEDTKSFETLRDTIGQKPTEKVEAKIETPIFKDDLNE